MNRPLPEQLSEFAYVHLYSAVLQDEMSLVNRCLSLPQRHITGYHKIAPVEAVAPGAFCNLIDPFMRHEGNVVRGLCLPCPDHQGDRDT